MTSNLFLSLTANPAIDRPVLILRPPAKGLLHVPSVLPSNFRVQIDSAPSSTVSPKLYTNTRGSHLSLALVNVLFPRFPFYIKRLTICFTTALNYVNPSKSASFLR